MTEAVRPKMHIWGLNRVQRVIFVDEAEGYFERGWRDHPNKVGLPLDPEDLRKLKLEAAPKTGQAVPKIDAVEAPKKGRGKKQ